MKSKAISFVAWSGTGKTTLVEKVIRELKNRGYKVGAIKYDSHGFDIDKPGKDSYRMAAAGADTVILASGGKLAMIKGHDIVPSIGEILGKYFMDEDIVIVEGFKRSDLPKIEVHRKEMGNSLICRGENNDQNLLAVVTNVPLDLDVPLYDINDIPGITDFIENKILRKAARSRS
jgi:molybdopterin-guanine dinucleotide biosynthesis protein MobB